MGGTLVDQRAHVDAFGSPVAECKRPGCFGELRGDLVVNALLDEEPVGANAGLARIAIFARKRTLP